MASKHTPGPSHVHNPSSACSCTIEFSGIAATIEYCPVHAAAPDLLAACEASLSDFEWAESAVKGTNFQSSIILLRAAIAKARGEDK